MESQNLECSSSRACVVQMSLEPPCNKEDKFVIRKIPQKTSAPNATQSNNDLKPCDRSDRIKLNGCRMSYYSAPLQLSFDHTRRHQHKSHHYSELMGIPAKSRVNAHCYMIVFICSCVHFSNRHTFLRLKMHVRSEKILQEFHNIFGAASNFVPTYYSLGASRDLSQLDP